MPSVSFSHHDEHLALLGVLGDSPSSSFRSDQGNLSKCEYGAIEAASFEDETRIVGSERTEDQHQVIHPQEGLSPTVTTCIVINYISVGYVLLPASFARAGILLSTVVLVAVSLQSYVTASMVLEACARADALEMVFSRRGTRKHDLPRSYSMEVRHRKFELSVLSRIFLGERWAQFFTMTSALDLYGITWAISSIFASAMAEQVPLWTMQSGDNYHAYVLVFMCIVIPLSCTSLLDQLIVQMAFLAARMLMVIGMLATLVQAYLNPDRNYFGEQVGPATLDSIPLANFSGLLPVIQTCIFATAFQFSVPAIAGVSRNKSVLAHIFQAAIGFICASNLVVSLVSCLYFGAATKDSNNLNWLSYHGDDVSLSNWVSSYIVLFAAMDGIAVYPLITVSLGDNLMSAVYGENIHEVESNTKLRILFRLLASVPQAVGSMFLNDLGLIAIYAAIFTLLSYVICPALLAIRSEQRMKRDGLPVPTYYSSRWLPSVLCAKILIVVSAVIIVGVVSTGK